MIGFRGDIRSLLKEEGISDPASYTDESLRVNWYPDANGKKVLLVSIDKNRIFASRSGELIEAIFAISASAPTRLSITLLGIGGAIDAPELVGQIVTPITVMSGDSYRASRDKGVVIHTIRNGAVDKASRLCRKLRRRDDQVGYSNENSQNKHCRPRTVPYHECNQLFAVCKQSRGFYRHVSDR
jgi:hypothetical protein